MTNKLVHFRVPGWFPSFRHRGRSEHWMWAIMDAPLPPLRSRKRFSLGAPPRQSPRNPKSKVNQNKSSHKAQILLLPAKQGEIGMLWVSRCSGLCLLSKLTLRNPSFFDHSMYRYH